MNTVHKVMQNYWDYHISNADLKLRQLIKKARQ
ncbi:hypothetical protein EMIT0P218_120183 [Pseudomonas sp. IT-P218]